MIPATITPVISLEELTFRMDKYTEITYASCVQFIRRLHKYMNMGWPMVKILFFFLSFFLLALNTLYLLTVGLESYCFT